MSLCFELSMVLCHIEVVVGGGGRGGWGVGGKSACTGYK